MRKPFYDDWPDRHAFLKAHAANLRDQGDLMGAIYLERVIADLLGAEETAQALDRENEDLTEQLGARRWA